jgi:hypothetical protein
MSNPLRSVGLIVVMLVPAFGPLLGQEPAINSGAKVRVTMAGQRDPLIGILQGRSRDSLLVAVTSRKDSLRAIGMDQVTKVEKWDTRKGAIPKSWAIGTAVGALFGTVVGLVIPAGCEGGGLVCRSAGHRGHGRDWPGGGSSPGRGRWPHRGGGESPQLGSD